jgi:hypothetical protein
VNYMATIYSDEQNKVFVDCIEEYRNWVDGETAKETERLTKSFAKQLIREEPLISDRGYNGVAERLVYFDNLLAGIEFPFDYYLASTFEKYFGLFPRKNGSKEPNKWKTQHEGRRE